MNLQEIKTDKKKLLELREEYSTLRWGVSTAVSESEREGAIFAHDYKDTWDITHPKSGEPFKANSHWFQRFGTDEQKKKMSKRRREIELAIHAEERQRCEEISKEIGTLYQKYDYLLNDLEFRPCEGARYDGQNDFADILLVTQRVLEKDVGRMRCFMDGNNLCIIGSNFVDQQKSEVMFIDLTPKQITEFEKVNREG